VVRNARAGTRHLLLLRQSMGLVAKRDLGSFAVEQVVILGVCATLGHGRTAAAATADTGTCKVPRSLGTGRGSGISLAQEVQISRRAQASGLPLSGGGNAVG
jgi:hypothetical protein